MLTARQDRGDTLARWQRSVCHQFLVSVQQASLPCLQNRVEALAVESPDFEAIDALIGEYGGLIQQPVLMH